MENYNMLYSQAKYKSLKKLVYKNNLENYTIYFEEYDPESLDLDRLHDSIMFALSKKNKGAV